jgi:hypothetical protein
MTARDPKRMVPHHARRFPITFLGIDGANRPDTTTFDRMFVEGVKRK